MKRKPDKHRILILGGSGFIGNSIYKELRSYFEVLCTYYTQVGAFSENQHFLYFDVENHSMLQLLDEIKPSIIIAATNGDFKSQYRSYKDIVSYIIKAPNCQLLYLSSFKVFDARDHLPAFEMDTPMSISPEGKFKISAEKLFLESIPQQTSILRLPYVLGFNSPLIFHLRQCIRHRAIFDVYPNLVISATAISKVTQQVHYIINHGLVGIFHLSSNDMIHHDELFKEIISIMGCKTPIFKSVYSSNEDRYAAILPRQNILPVSYQINIAEVITRSSLIEEISTLAL